MKNSLGRSILEHQKPYVSTTDYQTKTHTVIAEKEPSSPIQFFDSLSKLMDHLHLQDHASISFHHHLRSGDQVVNLVCEELLRRDLKHLQINPSSIFPTYMGLAKLIEARRVKTIHTNYLNGPIADLINQKYLEEYLYMHTHGGRARAIECGEIAIDVAFLATPAVDHQGNGTGRIGKNACGTLGYAQSDLHYAKTVVLVTDTIVDSLEMVDFESKYVDYVLVVDSIGQAEGIVSGTTKLTKDPVGLKIAKDTVALLDELGLIKDQFSMQTGAGGISLAVTEFVKQRMKQNHIQARFASGGITKSYTEMLQEKMVKTLYDVQCFDLDAVESLKNNSNHQAISASQYANPYHEAPVVEELDFVILGATEIDLDFNTNVTTDSFGKIIGGSGGHADTAKGASVAIITTQLIRSRLPIIKQKIRTITTPGESVDVLVCERGIAINPKRTDLMEKLKHSRLPIFSIQKLYDLQHQLTGIPKEIKPKEEIVGFVVYRDGTILDTLYQY